MRDDLADGHGTRCGVTGSVGGDALGLKAEEQTEIPIGESEDEPAIVKHAVVPGVRPDIAMVQVNVVDAVEPIEISLGVHRLVQVPVELSLPDGASDRPSVHSKSGERVLVGSSSELLAERIDVGPYTLHRPETIRDDSTPIGVAGGSEMLKRWNWLAIAVVAAAAGLSAAPPATRADDAALVSQLAAIEPIDTHLHAYQDVPAVADLFSRFNLRALNITLIDDRDPFAKSMEPQWTIALAVRRLTKGRVSVGTTIDPYDFETPGFVARVNSRLNADFDAGAIAVKLYKVVGMELRRKDGTYVLPDDPVFRSVFDNIAAHHKTVVAHVAEPDSCWKAPDPKSPDYSYYNEHPEEYAYKHPEWPRKEAILAARDHLLQLHPNLKIVGAHLGSMEVDVDQIAQRFDKYPNFAVDTAARVDYLMMQKPEKVRAFLIKYQDRVVYGTDNVLYPPDKTKDVLKAWADRYERDWRYFSGEADVKFEEGTTRGLHLPKDVLRKLYHDNAVKWFPGIE